MIARFLAVVMFLSASPALATEPMPASAASGGYTDNASPGSKSDDWMIPPGNTGTLGLDFAFLTSSGPLSGLIGTPVLRFTDVVFLRIQGRYSIAGAAELIVDTSLLPKQPSFTDELVFQNAGLGFRIGIAKWLAAALRFDGGSTMAQSGAWGQASAGLEGRFPISDYARFDLSLFGAGTALFIDEEAPRFAEVGSSAQIGFYNPGAAGVWAGTSFYFPVSKAGTASWPIDPKVRVGVELGAVLSAIDKWDLYTKFSFVDRGDLVEPNTILPILDGGFDQQVLTVGVIRRFGETHGL